MTENDPPKFFCYAEMLLRSNNAALGQKEYSKMTLVAKKSGHPWSIWMTRERIYYKGTVPKGCKINQILKFYLICYHP